MRDCIDLNRWKSFGSSLAGRSLASIPLDCFLLHMYLAISTDFHRLHLLFQFLRFPSIPWSFPSIPCDYALLADRSASRNAKYKSLECENILSSTHSPSQVVYLLAFWNTTLCECGNKWRRCVNLLPSSPSPRISVASDVSKRGRLRQENTYLLLVQGHSVAVSFESALTLIFRVCIQPVEHDQVASVSEEVSNSCRCRN